MRQAGLTGVVLAAAIGAGAVIPVRPLPRRRRQRDDSGHAVARGPADDVHPLAAHQVPRRPAQGSPDVGVRGEPQRRRHGRPRRVLRGAEAARPDGEVDPQKVEDGKKAAVFYQCTSCYRPDLSGQQQAARLAGQDLDYLRKLIRGFKEKTASDLDGTMTMAAVPLSEDDIEILAQFLASLGGG